MSETSECYLALSGLRSANLGTCLEAGSSGLMGDSDLSLKRPQPYERRFMPQTLASRDGSVKSVQHVTL